MTTQPSIVLGPLLGVESDRDFTFCVLLKLDNELQKDEIKLQLGNELLDDVNPIPVGPYYYYRFEKQMDAPLEDEIYAYQIIFQNSVLKSAFGDNNFKFKVPGTNRIPRVGFISCSGFHSKYPDPKDETSYTGWKKLLDSNVDRNYTMEAHGG